MKAKEFVDSLFKGYEETAALADFKEELLANLNAKTESFVKKGMPPEAAFEKAASQLGDVSALADELSLKKRKEVFEEVYMDIRMYMPASRVAGYVVFGILAFFGISIALIVLFTARNITFLSGTSLGLTGFFGAMMPFLTAAAIGFTFLGVTQETASMLPVSKKRGAWYAAAAGLISFGLFTMPIVYFGTKFAGNIVNNIFDSDLNFKYLETFVPVICMIIPFILPGAGLLTFLILTEKDRLKPWAKDLRDNAVKSEMEIFNDPVTATRFGLISGAIWIFATGVFILLGFLIGFKYSWLVFIFTTGVQLLVQLLMSRKTA